MTNPVYANQPQSTNVTLRDVFSVLWRRSWVIVLVSACAVGAAYYVTRHTQPRWRATAELLLVQRAAPVVANPGQSQSSPGPLLESPETQIAMLQSWEMARRTVDWLKNEALAKGKSPDDIRLDPEELQKDITIQAPKETNLIDIAVEAGSRGESQDLANAVCRAFVDWKREVAKQNFEESLRDLEGRLERARAQMVQAEQQEVAFKHGRQMVDIPTQQQALLTEYMTRDADVRQLQQDLTVQAARIETLRKSLHDVNVEIDANGPNGRDETLLANLQADLNNLEGKRAELALRYNPKHPEVVALDQSINVARERLANATKAAVNDQRPTLQSQSDLLTLYKQAQVDLRFSQAKLIAATRQRDALKARTNGIPRVSVDYTRISQDAASARGLYAALQSAVNAARVNKDMATGNVQIAQYAYAPEKPFEPNRLRDMGLGGAVGLFLALCSVLLLEHMDRRLHNVDNIRRIVTGPVVGTLPRMSRWELSSAKRGEPSRGVIEAYNITRANLSLAVRSATQSDIWDHQIVMVTSAVPGEGKSFTAVQLARSIARTGKTVIVVDADMRRPSLNEFLGTDERIGLADVLEGRATLDEALVTTAEDNLWALFSGEPSRNPTELVSMPDIRDVLSRLRQVADVVILDTPACAVVADSLLMAPLADCILYVVAAGLADENVVRDATRALEAAAPKTMVYLVNRAPRTHAGGYSSYYAYAGGNGKPPTATSAALAGPNPIEELRRPNQEP